MAQETEVKIYLSEPDLLPQKLEEIGATLIKPRVFERNIRYENADNTLSSRDIVLRLRQDSRNRITYKEPAPTQVSEGTVTRTELETEVGDLDIIDAILQKLGFHPHMVYEKYRTTYELGSTEIVLDEMPYGHFIEIEGEAESIEAILQQLELAHARRLTASYVALFERIKKELGLTMRDLSFQNFEGIHLPADLFR